MDKKQATFERLGVQMTDCLVCKERFVVRRMPQHWVMGMLEGEPVDVGELLCSRICAERYVETNSAQHPDYYQYVYTPEGDDAADAFLPGDNLDRGNQ